MAKEVTLGLRANWRQFLLLVVINAFVGGMVGMERSILPDMAERVFALSAKSAILSFIIVFGLVKAITNYYTGTLANRFGRKNLLIAGWIAALPIPFMLMYAPNWNWIVGANILLGLNQGLAWSSTVVMKIDLAGERQRGLAMGLNEFAGYLAVALTAFLTAWLAARYGIRPYPFYVGVVLAVAGLLSSWLLVHDTRHHVALEGNVSLVPRLKRVFVETSWTNPNLGAVTQAGLINNLNDGMAWGLFPIMLSVRGFSLQDIGLVTAIYPAVWGLGQLITGALADRYAKKWLLFIGMALQAIALMVFPFAKSLGSFMALSAVLGWGTAMVYPTFLATVAEYTHPSDRAASVGVFRLWRDLGYAIGAIITGIIADFWSIEAAIELVAALTLLSAFVILIRMRR